jgi:hypothetical protein
MISSDIYFIYSKILKKKYGPMIEFVFLPSSIYDIKSHIQLFLNKISLDPNYQFIIFNANTMSISDLFLIHNISPYPSLLKYDDEYNIVTNEDEIKLLHDVGVYFLLYSQLQYFLN